MQYGDNTNRMVRKSILFPDSKLKEKIYVKQVDHKKKLPLTKEILLQGYP